MTMSSRIANENVDENVNAKHMTNASLYRVSRKEGGREGEMKNNVAQPFSSSRSKDREEKKKQKSEESTKKKNVEKE